MRRRVVSALVLMPIGIVSVWLGSPLVVVVVAVISGIMAWEWGRLVGRIQGDGDAVLLPGIACGAVLIGGLVSWGLGAGFAALGLILQYAIDAGRSRRAIWTAGGLAWILLGTMGFVWLRTVPRNGLQLAIWVFAIVWAVDVAAYAVGRTVGGPKLAPWISPKKTWAGLIGGVTAAAIVGLAFATLLPEDRVRLVLASGALAVVEQMGDMAESFAKRRFGVKDSSNLIPGHGGMLDRLDGMIAVVAVVLIAIVSGTDRWQ